MSSDTKTFGPYSQAAADALLANVRGAGMTVTGNNPWAIDANRHGITLEATRGSDGVVTVTVKSKNIYVSYDAIWNKVAPLMPSPSVSGADDAKPSTSKKLSPWLLLAFGLFLMGRKARRR